MKQKLGILFYLAFLLLVFGRDFPSDRMIPFGAAVLLFALTGFLTLRGTDFKRLTGGLLFGFIGLGLLLTLSSASYLVLLLPVILALYLRRTRPLDGASLALLVLFASGTLDVFEHHGWELAFLALGGFLVNPVALRTFVPPLLALSFYLTLPGDVHSQNLSLACIVSFFPGRPGRLSAISFTLPAALLYPDLWPVAVALGLVLDQILCLFRKSPA